MILFLLRGNFVTSLGGVECGDPKGWGGSRYLADRGRGLPVCLEGDGRLELEGQKAPGSPGPPVLRSLASVMV